ncbi:DUF6735 family protein [Natrinema pallidum]|uniref:Uncharacterized protein n=1 Tax=Natrinema pallidum DSM 3751 TaxID=1227495 RepID=L9Z3L6_9EURY|nr:DUF6735 family protein [Natrinema pallidum]ELY80297.1 hypothetical protein C487_04730 [Natrinema pallidum DSM 3751]
MGHRALVAYRRPDRLYDLRYSHWGGETLSLADEITATTPLADGAVEGPLLAASITLERILRDHLEPCVHEAFFLVAPADDYGVEAYRVCWLEWGDGRGGDRGAIVPTRPADEGVVTVWFRATKTALGDVIEMGALPRRAARAYLEARVCEERDGIPYTYGESTGGESTDTPTPDRWFAAANRDEPTDESVEFEE